MNLLPQEFLPLIVTFAPLFSKPVWESAVVLLVGAILAPGKRTVSAILRVMGLEQELQFQRYHRVLNRAVWSSRHASRLLLQQLVKVFAPRGVLVMGIDDTIERRWGKRIAARGIYRDPVCSSDSHFVKTSGLRWLSLMLLVKIPWAERVWALPCFTVLAPSERYDQLHHQRHKTLTDWARQMLIQVRRWVPQRAIVLVADSSFAALELLEALRQLPKAVHVVTRLRLDAALYDPAPQREPKQVGRPRKVGKRRPTLHKLLENPETVWLPVHLKGWYGGRCCKLQITSQTAVWYHSGLPAVPIRWVLVKDPKGKFEPQAFLSTDLNATPKQILLWFRQRWQVEVTFEEVRAHLGVETQRQWSDLAILRTTPALLALFSMVVLLAHQLQSQMSFLLPQSAWYNKELPTFIDALALVRQRFWQIRLFQFSGAATDMVKIPKPLLDCWSSLLCYAT
ncbi:MAG: transposase [Oculatellaceae cyanobacterium bins.114]|nr:transposase [Oculatellaceae cyanobacterium bins.114]